MDLTMDVLTFFTSIPNPESFPEKDCHNTPSNQILHKENSSIVPELSNDFSEQLRHIYYHPPTPHSPRP